MLDPIPAWQIQDAAIKARLRGSTMGVLLALLNFRQAGAVETWPSVGALAERTGYCERQVQRALRALEANGWISTRPAVMPEVTPHYTLLIPAMSPPLAVVPDVTGGVTSTCHRGGDIMCHPNTPEDDPLKNPSSHTQQAASSLARARSAACVSASPPTQEPTMSDPKTPTMPAPVFQAEPYQPERVNLTTVVPISPDRPTVAPVRVKRPLVGDEVDLPGDLLEALADMGSLAIPVFRVLEANAITTTAELLAVQEKELRYLRGMGPHKAQRLRLYFAERGILFADDVAPAREIMGKLTAHATQAKQAQEAPKGLRLIRGGER